MNGTNFRRNVIENRIMASRVNNPVGAKGIALYLHDTFGIRAAIRTIQRDIKYLSEYIPIGMTNKGYFLVTDSESYSIATNYLLTKVHGHMSRFKALEQVYLGGRNNEM